MADWLGCSGCLLGCIASDSKLEAVAGRRLLIGLWVGRIAIHGGAVRGKPYFLLRRRARGPAAPPHLRKMAFPSRSEISLREGVWPDYSRSILAE